MNRSDGNEGIIQIEHNTDHDRLKQDTWLVVRKQLTNASKVNHFMNTYILVQHICTCLLLSYHCLYTVQTRGRGY